MLGFYFCQLARISDFAWSFAMELPMEDRGAVSALLNQQPARFRRPD